MSSHTVPLGWLFGNVLYLPENGPSESVILWTFDLNLLNPVFLRDKSDIDPSDHQVFPTKA